MSEDVTKVVFRKWNDADQLIGDGIIALFPEDPSDLYGQYCMSYAHVGQHGGADYEHVVWNSRLATEEEYTPLKKELEDRGYTLEVRQRCTPQMRQKRLDTAREYRKEIE